jgi:hypothetical protein
VDKINHLGLSPTRSALARRSRQKALPPTLFIQTRFYHLHPFLRAAPPITLAPSHPHPLPSTARVGRATLTATLQPVALSPCTSVIIRSVHLWIRSPVSRFSHSPHAPYKPNPTPSLLFTRCVATYILPFPSFASSILCWLCINWPVLVEVYGDLQTVRLAHSNRHLNAQVCRRENRTSIRSAQSTSPHPHPSTTFFDSQFDLFSTVLKISTTLLVTISCSW